MPRMLHPNHNRYKAVTRATVLTTESRKIFIRNLDSYHQSFHPQNAWEADMVDEIHINYWRRHRMLWLETAVLDREARRDYRPNDPVPLAYAGLGSTARALRATTPSSTIFETIHRLERHYSRSAASAVRLLTSIRTAQRLLKSESNESENETNRKEEN